MKNLIVAVIVGGLALGCSQDSPTTPSVPLAPVAEQPSPFISTPAGLDDATVAELRARLLATVDEMSRQRPLTAHEDFTCENVEEVRARFSDPGFVDGLNVGLFLKFVGIPQGTKTLRIWWNFETSDIFEDIDIGDGDVNPEDPSRFDIYLTAEHGYATPGKKRVRVELILDGETGNCSRNRDVVVTRESFDHIASYAGLGACNPFFGGMGIRVKISPPIPAGKSYTVRARLDQTGVAGPVFMFTSFSTTLSQDLVFVGPIVAPTPAPFTATLNTTVPHGELQVGAQFGFPVPTSMNLRVVSISIPGKTVGFAGPLAGTCP